MENANKDTYTLGLDLGNATHALCVLNSTGDIVEENTIANEKEALSCLSARYPSHPELCFGLRHLRAPALRAHG